MCVLRHAISIDFLQTIVDAILNLWIIVEAFIAVVNILRI